MENKILNIFFPKRCCGCDKIAEKNSPVCKECAKKVLYPSKHPSRCDICFLPKKECVCSSHLFYDKISAPFINEGSVKKTVSKMKFYGRLDLIKPFAELMAQSLRDRKMLDGIDIITFIPMENFAKFKRGYNQAHLLANELSTITGKPCVPLLEKIFATPAQHSLRKISRSGNLLGVYEPIKENLSQIKDKTVLIIDDVITTGGTVNEAAKTLLIFGANRIEICVCAITKKTKKL